MRRSQSWKMVMCEPAPIPRRVEGQCGGPLQQLAPAMTDELLEQAALVRFRRKAAQIEARARQRGWDQALWEELLGALGYKHNTWPMRRVAELAPLKREEAFDARCRGALFGNRESSPGRNRGDEDGVG